MGSRVTRKGQVTIPKRVRDHLGIEPGSVVEFEVAPDGRIVLVRLVVNPLVYAELSVGFDRIDKVDTFLAETGIELVEILRSALFLAGKAFQSYLARGGTRTGVLPDFFIGAHAVVEGIGLLTRDTRRYRGYFPTITLITPGDA